MIPLGKLCDDGCQVLLDKKSRFVVKEKELVIEGYLNEGDLLWDIPVQNPDLLKSKHTTIPEHAGLYSIFQRKNIVPTQKLPTTKTNKPQYNNTFHTFDDLKDFNKCVNLIKEQEQLDCKHVKENELALIIRKNQTKNDLATFLIAVCFNPVASSLLKAIKNNHFTFWPGMDINL